MTWGQKATPVPAVITLVIAHGLGPCLEALILCQYLQKSQNTDLEKVMLSILVSKGEPVELTAAMSSLDR